MSRKALRRMAWLGTVLIVFLLAADVLARGRGGGGFSRGGGGFSRGGGGGYGGGGRATPNISRRGPSSGGTLGRGASYGGSSGGISAGAGGGLGSGPGGSNPRPATRPTQPSSVGDRQPGQTDPQQTRPDDPGDRRDDRSDRLDERLDNRKDAREEIQEYNEKHHYSSEEYYEDRWNYAVGSSMTAARYRTLSCTTSTVVVGNVTYYSCGETWYNRAYSGGTTTYVVVDAPPGH